MVYIIALAMLLALTPIAVAAFKPKGWSERSGFAVGLTIGVLGILTFSMSCASQTVTPSAVVVATVKVEGTVEVVSTVVEVIVTPEPELARSMDLCEAAFSSAPGENSSTPQRPVRSLVILEYREDRWRDTARSVFPDEVRSGPGFATLICIKESRQKVGTYDKGGTAYKRIWTVRLVNWQDGTIFAEEVFQGTAPPLMNLCPQDNPQCDGYGNPPIESTREWVIRLMEESTS